jgi:ubiquitin carboxyl-terminal hydrolase 9/24
MQLHPSLKSIGKDGGLMEEIFKCLFELPTTIHKIKRHALPPKCKTRASRTIAFKLLEELVKDCSPNMIELARLIQAQHLSLFERGQEVVEWNYSPSADERSPIGYVGLRNLGCTCYMNSLLQQLVCSRMSFLISLVYDAKV